MGSARAGSGDVHPFCCSGSVGPVYCFRSVLSAEHNSIFLWVYVCFSVGASCVFEPSLLGVLGLIFDDFSARRSVLVS